MEEVAEEDRLLVDVDGNDFLTKTRYDGTRTRLQLGNNPKAEKRSRDHESSCIATTNKNGHQPADEKGKSRMRGNF